MRRGGAADDNGPPSGHAARPHHPRRHPPRAAGRRPRLPRPPLHRQRIRLRRRHPVERNRFVFVCFFNVYV